MKFVIALLMCGFFLNLPLSGNYFKKEKYSQTIDKLEALIEEHDSFTNQISTMSVSAPIATSNNRLDKAEIADLALVEINRSVSIKDFIH